VAAGACCFEGQAQEFFGVDHCEVARVERRKAVRQTTRIAAEMFS
jgi:hypothetical protein